MRKFIRFFLTGPGAILIVLAIAITVASNHSKRSG